MDLYRFTTLKLFIDASYIIPKNMNLIMKNMGISNNYYCNVLFYQDFKTSNDKEKLFHEFIGSHADFYPDFKVIYNEWKDIEIPTIIYCIENKNIRVLNEYYKYYLLNEKHIKFIINILFRSYDFDFITVESLYHFFFLTLFFNKQYLIYITNSIKLTVTTTDPITIVKTAIIYIYSDYIILCYCNI